MSFERIRQLKLILFGTPLLGAYFFGHTQTASPFFCPLRVLTGIPCPGCGLTRSFIAITQGDLIGALNYHLFGPFLFLGLSITCGHLGLELVRGKKVKSIYAKFLVNSKLQLICLGILLIYHGLRLYALTVSGELLISFQNSPLGNLMK